MRSIWKGRHFLWLAAGIIATSAVGACSHPNYVYDEPYATQRVWDGREQAAYRRWEAERRMEHVEYQRRSAAERRAYWQWRHDHQE